MRQYFAIEGNSVYPWNDAGLNVSAGRLGQAANSPYTDALGNSIATPSQMRTMP